ncbi:TIGR01777 family oxidoreductase [Synechocystis sp. LKSZ1]|uniref:thylakoid membrane protein ThyD n=1 Tax=Synechocystis sp. LKSZ1 TaxID=3144951 RepID=UPI00336BAFD4
MKIVITGATGFVGQSLVRQLSQAGHSLVLLVRNLDRAQQLFPTRQFSDLTIIPYQATVSGPWQAALEGSDAVINLAGEPISERWNAAYKQRILDSRQLATQKLVEAIGQATQKPQVLISTSAIGYYGTSETASFTETSPAGTDFLAQVCQAWESAAKQVESLGVRLVILRLGIVLGNGGALAKMLPPFQLFAGGPIGSGQQWFSWIDQEDLLRLIQFALTQPEVQGTFNATAPNPVRMVEFCQTLGQVLKRPSWLPVPELALELLLGEAAKLVLEGQQVLPQATQAAGFQFQYPTLQASLKHILA